MRGQPHRAFGNTNAEARRSRTLAAPGTAERRFMTASKAHQSSRGRIRALGSPKKTLRPKMA